ncbi:hypothetical protein [Zooshikella harenae]|uniref:DUF3108 domain-containing protein n=1 Tax=Zooshikella harenae TaxID=2827238 RepID=A0ABS5Z9L3_9GAMM|nr:hypothetical protein [Zooshikella harenae]MBU2710011.1 hypothetical protein [Zooshikella harenae]
MLVKIINKWLKYLGLFSVSTFSIISTSSLSAKPVSPLDNDISHYFSKDMQDNFYLFADSTDQSLIWFVSKQGGIEVRGSEPSITIDKEMKSSGLFKGKTYLRIFGILSPNAKASNMKQLQAEAQQLGLSLSPVYAKASKTLYNVQNIEVDNHGKAQAVCSVSRDIDCKVRSRNGEYIPSSLLFNFRGYSPKENVSVSQTIPFKLTTLPGVEAKFLDLLMDGKSWDSFFNVQTQWTVEVSKDGQAGEMTLNTNMSIECVRGMFGQMLWLYDSDTCQKYRE